MPNSMKNRRTPQRTLIAPYCSYPPRRPFDLYLVPLGSVSCFLHLPLLYDHGSSPIVQSIF